MVQEAQVGGSVGDMNHAAGQQLQRVPEPQYAARQDDGDQLAGKVGPAVEVIAALVLCCDDRRDLNP